MAVIKEDPSLFVNGTYRYFFFAKQLRFYKSMEYMQVLLHYTVLGKLRMEVSFKGKDAIQYNVVDNYWES